MSHDPYRTLGVGKTATLEQIKSAYRRLARENHPDAKPGDKAAESRFKDISGAYRLLSDPQTRRKFDAGEIDASGNPKAARAQSGYEAYRQSAEKGSRSGFGFGGAKADSKADAKKSRFNGFFRDKTSIKAKGADITYTLRVDAGEAAKGADKTVRMTSGKTFKVRIPPATQNGQVLRLQGQGMAGLGGGKAGDALVEILIEQTGTFRTEGLDVHSEEPVTLAEALLGARIEVKTVHGPVLVTVPEGANTGTKLRLKGKGQHKPGADERGDHYVTLKVMLPQGQDEELKRFVKTWSAKKPYSVRTETLKRTAAE